MPKQLNKPTGLYWEDIEVGDTAVTQSRTVTETDIVNFLGLAGIFEEIHMSTEYMKTGSVFGRRVSPGPLTFIIQEGLVVQTGLMTKTGMALLGIEHMTWPNPVYCNDTIHVEIECLSKRETSKTDRGILSFKHTVKNQAGEVVLQMDKLRMLKRRPEQ